MPPIIIWIACATLRASTPSDAAFSRSGTMRTSGSPSFRLDERSTKPPSSSSRRIISVARRSSSASSRLPRICDLEGSRLRAAGAHHLARVEDADIAARHRPEFACARRATSSITLRLRSSRGFSVPKIRPMLVSACRAASLPPPLEPAAENRPDHLGLPQEPLLVAFEVARAWRRATCPARFDAREEDALVRGREELGLEREAEQQRDRASRRARRRPVAARWSSVQSSSRGSAPRSRRSRARGL